jgi:hypothetical protein
MLKIKCPNYDVCSKFITSRDTFRQITEDNLTGHSRRYTKTILCTPVRDMVTGTFILKTDQEIPLCYQCAETYTYLSFIDSMECTICFKTEQGVSFPNCMHYTCIPCHKRCWFGPPPVDIPFPHTNEIRKLYYTDPDNPIWKFDKQIQEYIKESNRMEDQRMEQWEREDNLRLCPICRN